MIKFTKMHGLGNDYVYIDCTEEQKIKNISSLAQFISNRHFGVGSDGLILICKSDIADFKMRMFNYDGTEAEMCGNGIRCVGKFVYDKGLTKKDNITVETLAGIKKLKFNIKEGNVETVEVDMGEPILEPYKVPVISEEAIVKNLKIKARENEFKFTCVSMGNPHAITIVDNTKDFNIEKYGPVLEKDEHFPRRANIEFIELVDKNNIKMRVWERGAGETLACGTGACASVVACALNGYIENEANVELLGGTLKIRWDKENNHIYMTGPATTVFEGEIDYKED
ncbi:diaminopimelate epimerase [Clostridium sp. CAG:571]|jgi:diaminopimelate epimerase|nr:diaminopimelate epimerase [Clostridium sp. CAG:571]